MQVKGQIVTDCHTLPPALKLKVDLWDLGASHAVIDAGHGGGGGALPSATARWTWVTKAYFPFVTSQARTANCAGSRTLHLLASTCPHWDNEAASRSLVHPQTPAAGVWGHNRHRA